MDTVARTLPIRVRLVDANTSQGTAWFVDDMHLVTALHVVGSLEADAWAHDLDPRRHYELGDGRRLTSVAKSAASDVAVLRAAQPQDPPDVVSLGTEVARGTAWYTIGFPGFHSDGFALTGKIVNAVATQTAKALQLHVDQGTSVDWGGISGSPVIAAGGAVGVITNATDSTATAWAAPIAAVRALLEGAGIVLRNDACSKDLSREFAELRLAAVAALATESVEIDRIRSTLLHQLELGRIHETRIEHFKTQLRTPLAAFTPHFEEQLDERRRALEHVIERLRTLLIPSQQ